ncbi:MAG: glycoside hydrolase family protein [bacterium]
MIQATKRAQTSQEVLDLIRADTERDEGRVPHLYLCTGGYVTVGVGHQVASLDETLALPLVPREAIAADYEAVRKAPKGYVASWYGRITRARMSDADIDALLAADIQRFLVSLRPHLPIFDEMPPPAQRAVFNMAFNLGLEGFAKYRRLRAALEARDWERAAAECHRRGISAERNARTAELFRSAAHEVLVIAEAGGQQLPGQSENLSTEPGLKENA